MGKAAKQPVTKMRASDVSIALAWRHTDDFTITECKSGATWFNPNLRKIDFLAIAKSWSKPCTTGYEIKVSRQDFLADDKWPDYLKYCDKFSFACPKGLITKADIEAINIKGVGLVHVSDKGYARTVIKPLNRQVPEDADFLMYIIMNRLDSDRIPFYGSKAELWQSWLDRKESTRVLGRKVGSALVKRLAEHEEQVELSLGADRQSERIIKALEQHFGITDYWGVRNLKRDFKALQELKDKYGDDINRIFRNLEEIQGLMTTPTNKEEE